MLFRCACRRLSAVPVAVIEHEFWVRLERRICAEFRGSADKHLRYYWCDGLVPEAYDFTPPQPRVTGLAWCGGTGRQRWQFTLLLAPGTPSREAIDWAALVPADGLTGWFTPSVGPKTMTIDPLHGHRSGRLDR